MASCGATNAQGSQLDRKRTRFSMLASKPFDPGAGMPRVEETRRNRRAESAA
jgi:hypothetical protein